MELSEHKKNDRLKARYRIFTGEPYIVEHIAYDINDYKIDDYMLADSAHTLLHPGMRFDVNQLDAERQRITRYLQDHGYYRFNKDFITLSGRYDAQHPEGGSDHAADALSAEERR